MKKDSESSKNYLVRAFLIPIKGSELQGRDREGQVAQRSFYCSSRDEAYQIVERMDLDGFWTEEEDGVQNFVPSHRIDFVEVMVLPHG